MDRRPSLKSAIGGSNLSDAAAATKRYRRMRSVVTSLIQRRSVVRVLFAGGLMWAVVMLAICAMLLMACGSVSVTSAGQCKKKTSTFFILDALGFIPKPLHRCTIPLAEDVYSVKIPLKTPDDGILKNLTYITRDTSNPTKVAVFGGYQTWKEREESFHIQPHMQIHCGFVEGGGGDIDEKDKEYSKRCEYVVASGIFDAYDIPHQPSNISEFSRIFFCFMMVIDDKSLEKISAVGNVTEDRHGGKWVGIWRLMLLRNLPYDEPRRNGKVPKLLLHRIFPEARYSIWIDGKMELLVDPLLVLERYLWRNGDTFAIAQHKHHRSIFEEADANKRRKRYARPLIDKHMQIYKQEGMQDWTSSKLPLLSDVPEGAVIVREHTMMTNLFSCLWFNEVNRFTPRDQLSFGYVVYRLNNDSRSDSRSSRSDSRMRMFMFPNCEYNALFVLHRHTREHSSKVEWVKSFDELKEDGSDVETRGGFGLFDDAATNSTS